ncbi:hypothetical protein M8C17_09210 [Micromonospora sp. RHAY321]|uniref:hypothetical protein n=1 Tax=unclassified Micromonospora TaxID=2617518 RepID=UPI00207CDE46|nr:hypothetical protein [Micromonospora sp. RHAY321]MCO1595340.1 hypothetical protein [Micromonospora sp. RHAY321]
MTSNNSDRPVLFLATATADAPDGQGATFDGSEEAMRRLRHPFAVTASRPTAQDSDNGDQRD